MSTDPKLQALLGPLVDPEDDLAPRRVQVDREKIISRMVEVSVTPEQRFGTRARVAGAVAAAAALVLASWGGLAWYQRAGAASTSIEVVALRGSVTGRQGAQSSNLRVGATTTLAPAGTLETSQNAEAQIAVASGLEITLLENTRVSLSQLIAGSSALRLERGRVRCVVAHEPGRTFSVLTSVARVVDVGTTFSVSVEDTEAGPKTIVHVEEGEVLVLFAGGERRLTAAQSWVSATEPPEAVEAAPAKPIDAAPANVTADEPTSAPTPRREAIKRRAESLETETKLLRSGLASEQKGDFRAAAAAFQALVSRYPDSQLAPDAKAALVRVKGRQESQK